MSAVPKSGGYFVQLTIKVHCWGNGIDIILLRYVHICHARIYCLYSVPVMQRVHHIHAHYITRTKTNLEMAFLHSCNLFFF